MKRQSQAGKRIRKGDKVIATAGNDKGKVGTVLSRIGDKAIVQGLNLCKKHVRKSQENPQGGIIEMEKPIHLSNLQLCVGEDQPVRLKAKMDDKGNKDLYYVVDGKETTYRSAKKANS